MGTAFGGATSAALTMAEQLVLAPILLGETITSTSLVAAQSSFDVLTTTFFPGSDEASFSLASFVTLVKREWNTPALGEHLPAERFSVTDVAKALVAWAALQGVTQEWQERQWFRFVREIDVNEASTEHEDRNRRESHFRITNDALLPRREGRQIITADIGEAEPDPAVPGGWREGKGTAATKDAAMPHVSHSQLKSNLRRFSKMVLAGYGGMGLIFFGVSFTPQPRPSSSSDTPKPAINDNAHTAEERAMADAVDAAEQEAFSSANNPAPAPETPPQKNYSWWNVLMGRHDKDIFEGYAFTPATVRDGANKGKDRAPTAVVGSDPLLPRYWILTDHGRRQVVLVFRGTMK